MYKLNLENSQRYILGGKANFIVKDTNNQDHIEFKVRQDPKNESIYYIRYKGIDWYYIGYIIVSQDKALFYPSIKGEMTDDNLLKADIFKKLILYIYHLNSLPKNIEILYTGVCSVCGRKLTDPIYIEIGVGKICLENNSL